MPQARSPQFWCELEVGSSAPPSLLRRGMAGVRDHRELNAWKLANEARIEVLALVERAVFRAHADLKDDMLRAADSACFNIAEGFSRYLPKDHAKFLRIAKASLTELIDQLYAAALRRLITKEEEERIASLARRACGALVKLIRYLDDAEAP